MIFVKVGDKYINVNHIITVLDVEYPKWGEACEVVYGIAHNGNYSYRTPSSAKKVIQDIRKQIKEQLKETPELAFPSAQIGISRFDLMDVETE